MITVKRERYASPCVNRNKRSIYAVHVDNAIVYRGTRRQCHAKVHELKDLHTYTTDGLSQMQGFQQHFRTKYK